MCDSLCCVLSSDNLTGRQMQREPASYSHLTHNRNPSAHSFRDTLGKRQSESRPVNLRRLHHRAPVEGLEDLLQLRGINPDPVIFHADAHFFSIRHVLAPAKCTNGNAGMTASVLHCVQHEVLQTLANRGEIIPAL